MITRVRLFLSYFFFLFFFENNFNRNHDLIRYCVMIYLLSNHLLFNCGHTICIYVTTRKVFFFSELSCCPQIHIAYEQNWFHRPINIAAGRRLRKILLSYLLLNCRRKIVHPSHGKNMSIGKRSGQSSNMVFPLPTLKL